MSKLTDRVYSRSPVWFQELGINVFGWYWARRRLGPFFEETWRAYRERETWSSDRMHEYIDSQLRTQVKRAYAEVPYYRQAFRAHGITEERLDKFSVSDLTSLPFLEKPAIRADSTSILTARAAQRPPKCFHTSGTTGTPIRVYWSPATHQHNTAVREARSFRWAGVTIRDPRCMMGGRSIVPKNHSHPPFWRYNHWEKQLYFSAFHISKANLPDYVAALNRFRPSVLVGYAFSNTLLARLIQESGVEVHSPRAIITTSEKLESDMRDRLTSVFRSKVYEEYGSVENCGLATECERGALHVSPDFGFMEIIRSDNKPAGPGEIGEIVLTGFANTDQIFIRYRTGDLGVWSSDGCACGRSTLPVLARIVGRQEDALMLPGGRQMVRFHSLFTELAGIAEGQVVQEALDRFLINVVPSSQYTQADADIIKRRLCDRYELGPEISVEVRRCDSIPRGANGKFRAVVNLVPKRELSG